MNSIPTTTKIIIGKSRDRCRKENRVKYQDSFRCEWSFSLYCWGSTCAVSRASGGRSNLAEGAAQGRVAGHGKKRVEQGKGEVGKGTLEARLQNSSNRELFVLEGGNSGGREYPSVV